ncbi:MAG: 2-hydroxyacid dehydrogenase [Pseudothermotoga sp.]|uniref:2-hydroxyacid dehydrogenase n=1 Tax=Pseudothermotoga sp. TaxID=2033661 RepID=UPI00258E3B98|nr:2-hydroxyacid dehydrogenase [Pseudothermotoga sp.]MDI6863699.1 2-hydroxyacid dehydrogenase [Pseudothermotoga sp.]
MQVLFLNRLNDEWLQKMEQMKNKYPHVSFKTRQDGTLDDLLRSAHVIVTGRLSAEHIHKAENLRLIIVPMAGVNALDWHAIREKKIEVCNCHSNAFAVAERAIALALALLGRVVEYDRDLRYGVWHGYAVRGGEQDYWTSLQRKRVCIVGFGHIGQNLARLLEPFSCEIVAVKRSAPKVKDRVTSDLDWAMERSEVIFITLPLTKETRNLFNRERLFKMRGKFLINVSRGDLLDEQALFEALKEGVLAGAAIDTWYTYPSFERECVLPSRFPFNMLRNVVMSPHVGGYCPEASRGLMNETFEILEKYILTGELTNRVDPEWEY